MIIAHFILLFLSKALKNMSVIMSLRPYVLKVSFHHASTILEELGWKLFLTLTTHNSGGIFLSILWHFFTGTG